MLKVLVVGQTPPPFNGQAIMIDRLLKSDPAGIELTHVRMGFSTHMNELGRVLEIADVAYAPPPQPLMSRAKSFDAMEAVPIQPGENEYTIQVSVTFELR